MQPRPFPFLCVLILMTAAFFSPTVADAVPLWTADAPADTDLTSLAIPADGSVVIAGGGKVMVLTPDGRKVWSGWSATNLDVSVNGDYIVTSQGPMVRLFSRDGILLWEQTLGTGVETLSISPDGILIAAGGADAVQAWFNSGTGAGINVTARVRSVRVSPIRDQIVVATATALRTFNLSIVPRWYDSLTSPDEVAVSGDGSAIVVRAGNHIRMYHGGGTLLWDRQVPGGSIVSFAYSRDGSTIIAGRDDNTVIALDRAGDLLFTGRVNSIAGGVAVSDNGTVLAAGTLEGGLYVWDRKGTELGTFRAKSATRDGCVAVSGDGSLIAATDGTKVYGFRWSQFGPAVSTTATVPAATPSPVTTTETIPATSVPVTTEPVSATTTPASGHGMFEMLSIVVVVLLLRKLR